MIEIKVTVDIPGIAEAINNLAQAIAEKKPVAVEAVKQEAPVVQASAPVAPAAVSVIPTATTASAPAQQQAPAAAKRITLDDLSLAGAKLVDAGKMDVLINALQNFGVAAITLLHEDQYASFADCLRSMGANI